MDELKKLINAEIKIKLIDIQWRLKNDVPMQFISNIQQELFQLQWVLEQIEKIENGVISQQNND